MPLNLASPGIVVKEIDLTIGRVAPSTNKTGAIVSPFAKGPVDSPTLVENENDLLVQFGEPYATDKHYENWLVASSYLAYGGSLRVIRANGNSLTNGFVGTASSVKIDSLDHYNLLGYDENTLDNVVVAAQNPGSWSNDVRIAIIDSKADQILGVTTTGAVIGYGISQSVAGRVNPGIGVTSTLTGYLKGIITGIAAGEMPFALDFEQLVQSDTEAGPGAKMIGGLSQFVGAFAGVGKLFKVGSGLVGAASQGAAADFLGFEGNEGRLTDLLLELGVPENRVTDFLRTDPNDPDYVGRFKNALEGGVLGVIADQIAPVYRMIKEGGSKTELGQAIGDLRFQSRQLFSDRLSDVIGAGRAIAQGDTEMLGEVFQRGRPPQSLSAGAVDTETAGAITAFHGSPYDFDAFDIGKMGTGEGNQAYGPGLYFAEAEGVAKEYRDSMLDARIPPLNDKLKELSREMNEISSGYRQWKPGQQERGKELSAEYDKLLGERSSMRGRLYQVNIKANPEDFLNWDAPISQQSEKVRQVLMPFVEQRIAQMGEAGNRFTAEQWMDRLRGGDVMLLDKVGDTPVSKAMVEAGVPGVRYLDQASRRGGDGTRNYVVFDDQLVDIVKKYGVAGLAVGAAVQSELGVNEQIEESI